MVADETVEAAPAVNVCAPVVKTYLVADPATTVIVPESVELSPLLMAWIFAVPTRWPVKIALLRSPAATRSPGATLPVTLVNDQPAASVATLATKLPCASRLTENTVIELPAVMFCTGTTVPVPFAAVSTRTAVALPAMTVIVPESVGTRPDLAARIVAVPTTWPEKVALLRSPAATKSPSTTPPVLVGSDQVSEATLDTKLPYMSRLIE